jgi:hypothetical protein
MPTVKNEFSKRHADILALISSRTSEGATASELSFEIKSLNCQELIVIIQMLISQLQYNTKDLLENERRYTVENEKQVATEVSP